MLQASTGTKCQPTTSKIAREYRAHFRTADRNDRSAVMATAALVSLTRVTKSRMTMADNDARCTRPESTLEHFERRELRSSGLTWAAGPELDSGRSGR